MPHTSLCPDPQVLQRLLLGQVPPAEQQSLAEHLLHCDACAQTMHSLKAEDTLVASLRAGAAAGNDPESGVIEDLIHRLEGLRASFASAEASATLAPAALTGEAMLPAPAVQPSPEGTVAFPMPPQASAPGEATEVVYDFLATAHGPGELGRLGPYRVLKVLGAGGMGVVFQAEDTNLERMVALKVMLPAIASKPSARRRFLLEAKAAAAIEHDHIVPIFQVGEDRGTPFLAMPLLKGETLEERLKRQCIGEVASSLPVGEVLRIGREVAEGLAAAHERALIHRDIKPSNIWLEGVRARVKILDFGLVRAAADTAHPTQSGAIVGTPAYMAPEQTRGGPVDHRVDLFSLGCVLYRMTTGELPFKGPDTMAILASLALDNPPSPRELDPNIPSALSDLVMQLLAKNPETRPPSAQAVVETIQTIEQERAEGTDARRALIFAHPAVRPSPERQAIRHEDSGKRMPVESMAPAPSGRTRARPSGRRWVLVAVVVALGVLGVGGYLLAPTIYRVATNRGQLVIEVEDPGVEVVLGKQGVTVHDSVTDRRYTVQPGRQDLPAGTYEVEVTEAAGGMHFSTREFTITRNGQAAVKVTMDRSVAAGPAPPEQPAAPKAGTKPPPVVIQPEPLPDLSPGTPVSPIALVHRPTVLAGVRSWTLETLGQRGYAWAVVFSPDGTRLATGGGDGVIRIWDSAAGRLDHALVGPTEVLSLAWSPDGKTLASGSYEGNGTARVWDAVTGRLLHTILTGSAAVSFSPDGKTLACYSGNGVRLWDVATGAPAAILERHTGGWGLAAWSPDGKLIATGGNEGKGIDLWEVAAGKVVRTLERGPLWNAGWSPDGKTLAGSGPGKDVWFWEVSSGKLLRTQQIDPGGFQRVAWSPDGKTLALASRLDGAVRLLDFASGQVLRSVPANDHNLIDIAWSPDGKTLATAGWDRTVRLLDVKTGKMVRMLPYQTRAMTSMTWSPDGKFLACAGTGNTLGLWEVGSAQLRRTLAGHPEEGGMVLSVAWSPDGKALASGGHDHTARLWDPETGKLLHVLQGHQWDVSSVAWSPDSRTLATGSQDKTVRLWETGTGNLLNTLERHGSGVNAVAFSPDGKLLASGSWDKTIRLCQADSDRTVRLLEGHTGGVVTLAWSPDGGTLASGSADDNSFDTDIRLWDPTKGKVVRLLNAHQKAWDMAWSPDGKTLASASGEREAQLWDAGSGQLLHSLVGHANVVRAVAWSPDGKTLVTGGDDGVVGFWAAGSGRLLGWLILLPDDQWLALGPDGTYHGSSRVAEQLFYVVQTEQGQETLSPEEFQKKYGWKNDPDRVGLIDKR